MKTLKAELLQLANIVFGLACFVVLLYVVIAGCFIAWDATFGTWHGWHAYFDYWPNFDPH